LTIDKSAFKLNPESRSIKGDAHNECNRAKAKSRLGDENEIKLALHQLSVGSFIIEILIFK